MVGLGVVGDAAGGSWGWDLEYCGELLGDEEVGGEGEGGEG